MAYSFQAPGNADVIDMGTGVTLATTFSVFVRWKWTRSTTDYRYLLLLTSGAGQYNFWMDAPDSLTNGVGFGFGEGGDFTGYVTWDAGIAADVIHAACCTYDGANLRIYADGDSTAKATLAETGTPDQGGTQHFRIGNDLVDSFCLDGTCYEVAWWPGTVLNGTDAAAITAATPDATGVALPSNYYPLIADPYDMFGDDNGVNSGAGLVAHAGRSLWPLASTYQPLYQRAPVLAY